MQEIAAEALFEGQYRRHKVPCKGNWGGGGPYVWDCGGDEIDEVEGQDDAADGYDRNSGREIKLLWPER